MATTPNNEFDVVVVGLGPAGATAALFLARYGVKVLAISRYSGTANTPRAHIFNQRAMEVLREAGLERAALAEASDTGFIQQTKWMHSLAGEEYGRVWSFGNKPAEKHLYELVSPCKMVDLPQSQLEPILVQAATQAGASLRFGHEFVALEQQGDSVTTTIRNRQSGDEYEVKSKFLVGADGGRSAIIDALGIPVDGQQIGSAFNFHVLADLSKYSTHRPGSLNWVINPSDSEWSVSGIRMVRPWNEWIASLMESKSNQNGEDYYPTHEQARKHVQRIIGDDSVPVEVLQVSKWSVNDQVARTWQKGRVLCIGDAVHRHPPVNGLGSNTCISDAYNLAWKMAYVLRGTAGPQLLDSLTAERKPVGDAVVHRAVTGFKPHGNIYSLTGSTAEEHSKFLALLQSATPEGRATRERLDAAFDATDLEHQGIGIQMNQIYTSSSAAIFAEDNDKAPGLNDVNLIKQPVVSTYPGHHLPHAWIVADSQSERISTLDICGKGRFTLLTGIGGECWRNAASEINASIPGGLELAVQSIGFRCDYQDCYRDWAKLRGVDEDGVLLVRPDHFVAWRYHTRADNATSLLRTVLSKILANPDFAKTD